MGNWRGGEPDEYNPLDLLSAGTVRDFRQAVKRFFRFLEDSDFSI